MTVILGVGGLANSVSFKRAHWPGLEEREYRISQGHDAAAALVVNGTTVAAAAEERFNRKKHSGDGVRASNFQLSGSCTLALRKRSGFGAFFFDFLGGLPKKEVRGNRGAENGH